MTCNKSLWAKLKKHQKTKSGRLDPQKNGKNCWNSSYITSSGSLIPLLIVFSRWVLHTPLQKRRWVSWGERTGTVLHWGGPRPLLLLWGSDKNSRLTSPEFCYCLIVSLCDHTQIHTPRCECLYVVQQNLDLSLSSFLFLSVHSMLSFSFSSPQ